MIERRKFLVGISALGIGGCSLFADPNRLHILGLSGAIPSKIVGQFEKQFHKSIEFKAAATPQELWKSLQELQQNKDDSLVPDALSLGDAWLDKAIANSLIQPFSPQMLAQISQWSQLAPRWQQLATRGDRVWGIPYRWGTTVIAYRTDKFKFDITSWADLWRPELKRKLTVPDDAREVIGLVLKKLGKSYQDLDATSLEAVEPELRSLHEQILIYTSDAYLQPLMTEDSWVAVGWSADTNRIKQRNPDIKVIVPKEGTALWSDLWVLPKKEPRSQNAKSAYEWMNFCLQPAIAAQITALTDATATLPALEHLPAGVKSDAIEFPDEKILAKSEPLLPLPEKTVKQYEQLWSKIRNAPRSRR